MTMPLLLTFLLCASVASAQTVPVEHPWSRGTTLQVLAGSATASPGTTGILGAAVGWELSHRAELEGMTGWLWQRQGAQAFAADMRLVLNLTRPAAIVPYVAGGAGLYRGSFDVGRLDRMPPFYRRRLHTPSQTERQSFTDPTAVAAAGAHLYVARHFSLRPEVALRLVTNESRTYRVTTVTFGLVYHVEDHVADARGPR